MNPVLVCSFDRCMHFLDVFRIAAGEATDGRATILIGDRLDRLKIAGRRGRKTGFDNIDLKLRQCLGDPELFPER